MGLYPAIYKDADSMLLSESGVLEAMDGNRTLYRSFMLRLWRVEGEDLAWRASLEDPHTGERQAFSNLKSLFDYLVALNDGPTPLEIYEDNLKEEGS